MRDREWNHNTFHHVRLLELVPGGRVLDVGCGDGSFAAALAARCDQVEAIDLDEEQVAIARRRCAGLPNVAVRQGDFLTARLPSEQYDAVTFLASLHHMPLRGAASEVTRVLRPGGRLVVLGIWTGPAANVVSAALNLALRLVRGPDVMAAPTAWPEESLSELRRQVAVVLPGAVIRRRLLWRYTLVWDKPATC